MSKSALLGKVFAVLIFFPLFLLFILMTGCSSNTMSQTADLASDAPSRVYVEPGKYDEFYAFFSGGYNGQVSVYGLPSGRLLKIIPVFSVSPQEGYGYSEETKALLMTTFGFIPWDDSHHPQLSMTNGVPNGKWLFINGNNTPRIARLDLKSFETAEILQIPNSAGNHSSPFTTMNSEYLVAGTRFSVPAEGQDVPLSSYKKNFHGVLSFVKVDPSTGKLSLPFQILLPGFDYDVAHCGKGPSKDWCFFTTYNTEQAHTLLEINASQFDKDYTAAINWKTAEACAAAGKGTMLSTPYYHNYVDPSTATAKSEVLKSERMMTPEQCPDMVYYIPTPKSPHGMDVDPSGEYIVGGGKLATVIPVFSYTKMQKAIQDKQFEKAVADIPVLKYDSVVAGEVQKPCLGPLHTEFDGKGNAYTTCFISSEIVKWKLGTWQIVDRIPTYYSPGHLMIPGGDSAKPWGKYLLSINKITKDRYLPTGPELAKSCQLIDISGNKMKLLLDFPTVGEPHYAQAVPADLLVKNSIQYDDLDQNKNPYAVKLRTDVKVVRKGHEVHVYMSATRSHFDPDNIEGIKVGDTVYFHVTNAEQDWNIGHGFAIKGNPSSGLMIMPGDTRTLVWKPAKPGIYPFYCTDFCSALHQEMQGYARVSPPDAHVALCWGAGDSSCK